MHISYHSALLHVSDTCIIISIGLLYANPSYSHTKCKTSFVPAIICIQHMRRRLNLRRPGIHNLVLAARPPDRLCQDKSYKSFLVWPSLFDRANQGPPSCRFISRAEPAKSLSSPDLLLFDNKTNNKTARAIWRDACYSAPTNPAQYCYRLALVLTPGTSVIVLINSIDESTPFPSSCLFAPIYSLAQKHLPLSAHYSIENHVKITFFSNNPYPNQISSPFVRIPRSSLNSRHSIRRPFPVSISNVEQNLNVPLQCLPTEDLSKL